MQGPNAAGAGAGGGSGDGGGSGGGGGNKTQGGFYSEVPLIKTRDGSGVDNVNRIYRT